MSEKSQIETAAALWKALQEGLVLPIGDVYKFYIGQETPARRAIISIRKTLFGIN